FDRDVAATPRRLARGADPVAGALLRQQGVQKLHQVLRKPQRLFAYRLDPRLGEQLQRALQWGSAEHVDSAELESASIRRRVEARRHVELRRLVIAPPAGQARGHPGVAL